MHLITLPVGALSTNCYIVSADGSSECAVIDPGAEGGRVAAAVRDAGLAVRYVLSTHGHADHTGGVAPLISALGGSYGIGDADVEMALDPPAWLTAILTDFVPPPAPALRLNGGETLALGESALEVIATPGHTPGSMCFRIADTVFTGDTLFRVSIGRYDLPGGDGRQELESIRDRLLVLDDAVRVLPGHGPETAIGDERRSNPFLRDLSGA